ncbi:hypothetical protein [Erwinia sp. Leaf53]|nr:hypothetical protein [Erwinia sp. Leaf53]
MDGVKMAGRHQNGKSEKPGLSVAIVRQSALTPAYYWRPGMTLNG